MTRAEALALTYDAAVLLLDEAIAACEAGDKEGSVAAMRLVLAAMDEATMLWGSAPVPRLQ
jgi:hypothetical protein